MSPLFPEKLRLELEGIASLQALELDKPCKVTLVLSNRLVRYAVVPWSRALSSAGEEEAYLRHHFVKIHGERAKTWALRASPAPADAPRLASAVDQALLQAIQERFPTQGEARLVSVQPQLMSQFNEWRRLIPAAGAWLVMAEPERACVALYAGGQWRCVRNGRGAWRPMLEIERHRQDGELPELVLGETVRENGAAAERIRVPL